MILKYILTKEEIERAIISYLANKEFIAQSSIEWFDSPIEAMVDVKVKVGDK